MGELMRFTLVRDVERREPEEGGGVPLLPAGDAGLPRLLDELAGALSSEAVAQSCAAFLDRGDFIGPDRVAGEPLGRFSAWLRAMGDRPSLSEIRRASPVAEILDSWGGETPADELWLDLRIRLAESLVCALLVSDADPKVAPALQRLLLVANLTIMLVDGQTPATAPIGRRPAGVTGAAHDEGDDSETAERDWVEAALRRRRLLLPEWLSRYPELTLRTSAGLLRRSRLVREPAMSDFYVVEDEWNRYEAAEVAHIENVLPRESKRRRHERTTESEVVSTTESDRTEVTEKDTQQTDTTEFSLATQTELELSFGVEAGVEVEGSYGPTSIKTHLAAEVEGSLATAEQSAFRVAREVTTRAASKVSERTRTQRTTRALNRVVETNRHEIDNADSDVAVVGVYRWVEQVRRLRVMRYPNRYLLEFLVPEPAAWWRWLAEQKAGAGLGVDRPTPFTANGQPAAADNPLLTAADMSENPRTVGAPPAYLEYAGRYGTVGVEPPPQTLVLSSSVTRSPGLKSTEGVTGIAAPANDSPLEWNHDASLSVPPGWEAVSWRATVLAWHDGHFTFNNGLTLWVTVGAGAALAAVANEGESLEAQLENGSVGPISTGAVPVGIMLDAPVGYYLAVEVTCRPTAGAMTRWHQRTYEAVRQAFDLRDAEFREAARAAATSAGVAITGLSPARAREVERAELKKHTITLMSGRSPEAPTDPWDRTAADREPALKVNELPRDEVMFLEQALEWENMRYVHYPYFWSDDAQWAGQADLTSADPLFAAFLRAGSTRVVVPARPGFEDAVSFYTHTLIPWGGAGAPAPDEPGYLSIADELTGLTRGPLDGTQVGTSWEIRLPTELNCLDEDLLPVNSAARIPPPTPLPAPPSAVDAAGGER